MNGCAWENPSFFICCQLNNNGKICFSSFFKCFVAIQTPLDVFDSTRVKTILLEVAENFIAMTFFIRDLHICLLHVARPNRVTDLSPHDVEQVDSPTIDRWSAKNYNAIVESCAGVSFHVDHIWK